MRPEGLKTGETTDASPGPAAEKVMDVLSSVPRAFRALENACVGILLVVICSVTGAQVVFRFILKTPLAWSDELATFSFVWFALLGAAVAVREKAHIGVDALTRALPARSRTVLAIASLLLIQLFLVLLVKFGIDLMLRIGDQRSSGLQIKVFWVYLALPVSTSLMLIHSGPEMRRLLSEVCVRPALSPNRKG